VHQTPGITEVGVAGVSPSGSWVWTRALYTRQAVESSSAADLASLATRRALEAMPDPTRPGLQA